MQQYFKYKQLGDYRMSTFKKVIFIILFITTLPTKADYPKTESDYALLPPYCKARDSDDHSAEHQAWKKRMGEDFIHIHHYCHGLHSRNLANSTTDRKQKNALLQAAVSEIEYLHEHASPKFSLLPKIAYDQGQIYEQMDLPIEALKKYQQSISLNPKNSQPYLALSYIYMKQNNKNEAIATLEQGLKYKPDSKSLRKQLEKLTKGK